MGSVAGEERHNDDDEVVDAYGRQRRQRGRVEPVHAHDGCMHEGGALTEVLPVFVERQVPRAGGGGCSGGGGAPSGHAGRRAAVAAAGGGGGGWGGHRQVALTTYPRARPQWDGAAGSDSGAFNNHSSLSSSPAPETPPKQQPKASLFFGGASSAKEGNGGEKGGKFTQRSSRRARGAAVRTTLGSALFHVAAATLFVVVTFQALFSYYTLLPRYSVLVHVDQDAEGGFVESLGGNGSGHRQQGPRDRSAALKPLTAEEKRALRTAGSAVDPGEWSAFADEIAGSSAAPQRPHAYVTLLCDEQFDQATYTMFYSLSQVTDLTKVDMVVLSMAEVPDGVNANLATLGVRVRKVTKPVPYPFEATDSRKAINKPCRYSKLLYWTLVEYEKVVALDGDLLIVQPIDDLFDRPELSAVPDQNPPDMFNSGVMVLEPKLSTFEDMLEKIYTTPSYNVGDQGFLNKYFSGWYHGDTAAHLPIKYNAIMRMSNFHFWKDIKDQVRVLHFSGEAKPWNMMADQFRASFGQAAYAPEYGDLWWSFHERTMLALAEGTDGSNAGGGGSPAAAKSLTKNPLLALPAGATDYGQDVCKRTFSEYVTRPIRGKFSIMINAFERIALLKRNVAYWAAVPEVYKIYINWGNTELAPVKPSDFDLPADSSAVVEVLNYKRDNLNDRFRPIRRLRTECLMVVDDDIQVDREALRYAFRVWKENPKRLVGFFPRSHSETKDGELAYLQGPKGRYSMMLTKLMLMSADYLRYYTCQLPPEAHAYIDDAKNCEDITINFMISRLSATAPIAVVDQKKRDFGTTSGLSHRGSHDNSRTVCMNDMQRILGYNALRYAYDWMQPFEKDRTEKVVLDAQEIFGAPQPPVRKQQVQAVAPEPTVANSSPHAESLAEKLAAARLKKQSADR